MMEMMVRHTWMYVSLLFSEGSYGENGAKQLQRTTRKRGICIAYSSMVISDLTPEAMSVIIYKLRKVGARVVVLFMNRFHHHLLLQHPKLMSGPPGELIFMGSDSIQGQDLGNVFNGGVIAFSPFNENPGILNNM